MREVIVKQGVARCSEVGYNNRMPNERITVLESEK